MCRRGVGLARVTVLLTFLDVPKYPTKVSFCRTVHGLQRTVAEETRGSSSLRRLPACVGHEGTKS